MYSRDGSYLNIKEIELAHEFVINRAFRCEWQRGRTSYGVVYCIAGCGIFRFGNKTVTLREGGLMLISQGAVYSVESESEFKHYTVNFYLHNTEKPEIFDKNDCVALTPENPRVYVNSLKEIISAMALSYPGAEMRAVGTLYGVLSDFVHELYKSERAPAYTRLLPAKEYIDSSFTEEIDVTGLASMSGMSVTNFRREWLKHFGKTSIQYRDSVRLSRAVEYLMSGYYTVSEVAELCGFQDVSYFVRFFKKHKGVPPGSFKKSLGL